MKRGQSPSPPAGSLRREAAKRLKKKRLAGTEQISPTDARALVHELQVHQTELEMQNEELQRAQAGAEEALNQYTALFDFAPIAYFILDERGLIGRVNLSGAALLGYPRSRLVQWPLDRFVAPKDRQHFAAFRSRLRKTEGTQTCEVKLLKPGHGPRQVHIEATQAGGSPGQGKRFLLAVSDITARKQAENALQTVSHELERRIDERTAELRQANDRLAQEVEKHKRIEQEEAEQLRFETLLADLSARFVNVAADQVDREIMDAERRICELLGLDVAALWQWSNEAPGFFTLTHYYSSQEGPQLPERMNAGESFPWVQQQMLAGRLVGISSLTELPAEAARDRQSARQLGIKSNLTLPLSVGGGAAIGAWGLNSTRAERDWPDALVKRLQLIAQIFANALARKRSDQALRASETRLAAGSELAGLGYYEVDYGQRTCFLDDRFRQVCGVPADVQEGLDPVAFWLEHVHPDDRQTLVDIRQKLHSGTVDRISAEYRYLHPAQGQRWLHHSARVAGRSAGGAGIRTFGVMRDITEQKRIMEQQAEDLRFVTLIADLSSRFVNLPASAVDREILDAERGICELLGLDVAGLWEWSREAPGALSLTHLHGAVEAPLPQPMQASDYFPWYQQQMLARRTVSFSSLDELPPEAARDREAYRRFGIKSNVTVPLSVGGEAPIGALGFNTTRIERGWPAPLVKRLQLIAQIFANALARKRSDQHLRESEEVNRATFEQAAVGIAHVGTTAAGCGSTTNSAPSSVIHARS